MDSLDSPANGVFYVELKCAIDAMLDALLARGYRVERFAFAFDAVLPDGTPVWGSVSTGYHGIAGVEALAHAAVCVLEAGDRADGTSPSGA